METSNDLARRLAFMGLDQQSQQSIRDVEQAIVTALPGALGAFYDQIKQWPETRAFFDSEQQVERARNVQVEHWKRIARGEFDQNYVSAVTRVGHVHARIGLEPRWYIGGYAMLLSQIITGVLHDRWPTGSFGRKAPGADARAAEIGAIVKAALLDMDYAISVYLEASEAARLKAEAEARAVEETKAAERDAAIALVNEGMAALANGDLTFRMHADIPSEYEQIREHFNAAMERLSEMVATIKASSASIADTSQAINDGATNLSARTEEQAAALEETAATTEQLSASVKLSAQSSSTSVTLADEATGIAKRGGEIVGQAVDAMARIETASKRISEITSVIDGIAFQTNLLALNAAVEAARAGEAGRGFAVVAAEVRALAQRSGEAAKGIASLVGSSNAEVDEGVRLVRSAGDALEQIVSASLRVSSTVQEIASASGEQANGIEEMAHTVSHMDEITQRNAAMADQSAQSARTLMTQIETLNELVAVFRTSDARGAQTHGRGARASSPTPPANVTPILTARAS